MSSGLSKTVLSCDMLTQTCCDLHSANVRSGEMNQKYSLIPSFICPVQLDQCSWHNKYLISLTMTQVTPYFNYIILGFLRVRCRERCNSTPQTIMSIYHVFMVAVHLQCCLRYTLFILDGEFSCHSFSVTARNKNSFYYCFHL